MLELMTANQALDEEIWLKVVIHEGWLEVTEANQPQKVSILL